MGMPKQEQLARALREQGGAQLIVCGGAILDFLAGKVSRAPAFMQSAGVEWLYRLAKEPRRLFKRYVVGNPAFLLKLLSWKRQKSY
jgi:N-acetylglucosaminyldiphosphoundecaprenol N-acetyl-beta-D-mannosaminyltransferase